MLQKLGKAFKSVSPTNARPCTKAVTDFIFPALLRDDFFVAFFIKEKSK